MLTEEIRRRLAGLNRERLPAALPPAPDRADLSEGHVIGTQQLFTFFNKERDRLSAGEEVENSSGRHFRLRRSLERFWPAGAASLSMTSEPPSSSDSDARLLHADLAALVANFPRRVMFLDLETCGFSGSMVFLIGLLWHADGELQLDQLLARTYAEESAILQTLWDVASRNTVLVTFNGKAFDWPMVNDRSTRHRLKEFPANREMAVTSEPIAALSPQDSRPPLLHCDILHHARRRWRRSLPNCKLQTLERYVCHRCRQGDIAGSEIPVRYHRFVKTGRASEMQSILHHNAIDLLTLAQVAVALTRTEVKPSLALSAGAEFG